MYLLIDTIFHFVCHQNVRWVVTTSTVNASVIAATSQNNVISYMVGASQAVTPAGPVHIAKVLLNDLYCPLLPHYAVQLDLRVGVSQFSWEAASGIFIILLLISIHCQYDQ